MTPTEKQQVVSSLDKAQLWLGNLHAVVWSFIQKKPVLGAQQFSDGEGLHLYLLDQVASIQREMTHVSDVIAREVAQGSEE